MNPEARPSLAPHVYLQADVLTGEPILIFPEEMLALNEQAEAILSRCDGTKSISQIIDALVAEYEAPPEEISASVFEELDDLHRRGLIVTDAPARAPYRHSQRAGSTLSPRPGHRPLVLLAELTYRCPLHCPYCSNPVRYPEGELSTDEWGRVFREAAQLGVFHVALSGGEPLMRSDLVRLTAQAAGAGLYPNLITSAAGLDERKVSDLRRSGLESVQLSYQSDESELADKIAGAKVHESKLRAARMIRDGGLALSLNVVLHRANIDRLDRIIALAESMGARRIELANVQYYGWGFLNRAALLPTREQAAAAIKIAQSEKRRLAGRMDIYYVLPDMYETRPKPCMQGWGRRYLTVNPAGDVLPCPTASGIPGLRFDNVRQHPLDWIWHDSESFNRFRGTEWMPLPCRECPQREIDFGGCRCQAALLTGDPALTDPVCEFSPNRNIIDRLLAESESSAPVEWTRRTNPSSPLIIGRP
ncbi:MAG: pyrroloquinoline quinone biosynthesis protein PqqE [Chthoniobacteraceae bacterium]|jgi:pyrroloquinoline quinone biosynthesis protein E